MRAAANCRSIIQVFDLSRRYSIYGCPARSAQLHFIAIYAQSPAQGGGWNCNFRYPEAGKGRTLNAAAESGIENLDHRQKSKGEMMRWRWPHGLLFLTLLSALTVAEAREAAPQFTASTLRGETFTNDSLKGRVTLLQFWTTWCPYCRRDQPVVENVTRDFSGQGLVVIAVNVRESRETVKKYLEEHARSCHIVLTEDTNLVAEFQSQEFSALCADRSGWEHRGDSRGRRRRRGDARSVEPRRTWRNFRECHAPKRPASVHPQEHVSRFPKIDRGSGRSKCPANKDSAGGGIRAQEWRKVRGSSLCHQCGIVAHYRTRKSAHNSARRSRSESHYRCES